MTTAGFVARYYMNKMESSEAAEGKTDCLGSGGAVLKSKRPLI